jgi:hypothetical protein
MALTRKLMKTLSDALRVALFAPGEPERINAFRGLERVVASNRLGPDNVGIVGAGMEALAAAIYERAESTGGDKGADEADKLARALAGLVAGGEELYTRTQLLELAAQYQAQLDQQTATQSAAAGLAGRAGTAGDGSDISDALGKAIFILAHPGYLTKWECEFAQSVHDQLLDPFYVLSPKQAPIFKKIYRKCGGVI